MVDVPNFFLNYIPNDIAREVLVSYESWDYTVIDKMVTLQVPHNLGKN